MIILNIIKKFNYLIQLSNFYSRIYFYNYKISYITIKTENNKF